MFRSFGCLVDAENVATDTAQPVYIEEPRFAQWVFASSQAAWIWLIARLWLGWEWFQAGWTKVFGGNITWRFWNWVTRPTA